MRETYNPQCRRYSAWDMFIKCRWSPLLFSVILPPSFSQITKTEHFQLQRSLLKGSISSKAFTKKKKKKSIYRSLLWYLACSSAELTNKDPFLSFVSCTSLSKSWWKMERHWLVWLGANNNMSQLWNFLYYFWFFLKWGERGYFLYYLHDCRQQAGWLCPGQAVKEDGVPCRNIEGVAERLNWPVNLRKQRMRLSSKWTQPWIYVPPISKWSWKRRNCMQKGVCIW